ncbi:hypothetical protein LCGC14_0698430 [marine sediment metagenome]|uniref:Uncharacterized protein n=1 Tax=marine sediment metagenome TaxID=412755 RepID=A0A0F9QN89_9ZZZZ
MSDTEVPLTIHDILPQLTPEQRDQVYEVARELAADACHYEFLGEAYEECRVAWCQDAEDRVLFGNDYSEEER